MASVTDNRIRPKPFPPFSPSLDRLREATRKRDQEIEERLHPKPKPYSYPESLSPEEDAYVDELMRKGGTIAKCGREQVKDKDLERMRPTSWLNDELINFYGQMLLNRSQEAKENKENPECTANGRLKPINMHYFNTFFWEKAAKGYDSKLAKWTKKVRHTAIGPCQC